MVPGTLFSGRLGVLPPPGFGVGGFAAGVGGGGLGGAVVLSLQMTFLLLFHPSSEVIPSAAVQPLMVGPTGL